MYNSTPPLTLSETEFIHLRCAPRLVLLVDALLRRLLDAVNRQIFARCVRQGHVAVHQSGATDGNYKTDALTTGY